MSGKNQDLEVLFKMLSDEEAEQLTLDNHYRLRRARLNPGAAVKREDMGAIAYEVVAKVAVLILEGTIEIKTASQARDIAGVFHQIARLETGKSTSNAEVLTRDEREGKLRELAEAAAERADSMEGLRIVANE